MKGFELSINRQKITATLEKGSFSIMASRMVNDDEEISQLVFSGFNPKSQEHHTWYKKKLEIGDEFSIKVIDVSHNSNPIHIEQKSSDSIIIEGKLKAYNALKKELENKGLI